MNFFHFAPMRLGPGSIVEPGNYGRVTRAIQRTGHANDGSPIIAGYVGRELMLELERVKGFPTKPSRLNSVFGCPTMQDAQQYAAFTDTVGRQVLHEVELVNQQALTRVAPISHCDITVGSLFVGPAEQKARNYWASAPAIRQWETRSLPNPPSVFFG